MDSKHGIGIAHQNKSRRSGISICQALLPLREPVFGRQEKGIHQSIFRFPLQYIQAMNRKEDLKRYPVSC